MTALAAPVQQQSLKGRLDLDFGMGEGEQTVARRRFRSGLFHFSKAYAEGDYQVLQILNPTAGIFSGDHLESEISLSEASKACLLSPSSTQVYQMPGSGMATSEQIIRLSGCSSLVFLPRPTVLHRDSAFQQKSSLHMKRGDSMVFLDQVSAGRHAFGEHLEYRLYDGQVKVHLDGQLLLVERVKCGKAINPWMWNVNGQSASLLSNLYISFPGVATTHYGPLQKLLGETSGDITGSITALDDDFVVLRLLSSGKCDTQRFLRHILSLIEDRFPVLHMYGRLG